MPITETSFKGVNEVISPNLLPAGIYSFGKNVRAEDGRLKCRGGHQTLVITNLPTSGNTPVSMGTIYGSVDFVSPDAVRYTLSFGASNAYLTKPGGFRRTLTYPTGDWDYTTGAVNTTAVTIDKNVQAVQCGSEVRVMRGNGKCPLRWDGVSNALTLVPQGTPVDTPQYEYMAPGQFAMYFYNRLFVLDQDVVKVSLTGNFDLYDPAYYLEVDQGTNDVGTGLYMYDKDRIVVTKKKSVYAITNITSDLSSIELIKISDTVGCEAPLGVFTNGADIYLPTTNGIFPVSQSYETRLQASGEAMSYPISKSYSEVNFSDFPLSRGIVHGNYYYLYVPMDSASGVGRVFVYSMINKEWCGYDEAVTDFNVAGWTKLSIGGKMLLAAVSTTGYIYLYAASGDFYDGYGSANADNSVVAYAVSRGFNYNDGSYVDNQFTKTFSKFQGSNRIRHISASIDIQQINSKYSLGYQMDGVGRVDNWVSDVTPSNTQYRSFGTAPWDTTNSSLDFNAPFRSDYSLYSDSTGYQMNGSSSSSLDGVYLDLKQSSTHNLDINKHGTYLQVSFTNKRGAFELCGIYLNSLLEQNTSVGNKNS